MTNRYYDIKELIRQQAMDYQYSWYDTEYSYGELVEIENYFEKYGKRYGLLKEFHENCIC